MRQMLLSVFSAAGFLGVSSLFACASAQAEPFRVVKRITSSRPITETARYSCQFRNLWSSRRHPAMYPSDAHWSAPLVVAHGADYQMWAPGTVASQGVERVAEDGSNRAIQQEISSSSDTGGVTTGRVTFNRSVQRQRLSTLRVDPSYPYLSSITMIAPSPDWFTGFFDFDARDTDAGMWYSRFSVLTFPFDAGTETGTQYRLNNSPQQPRGDITQFTSDNIPSSGVFAPRREGGPVKPVARWSCRLTNN